MWDWIIGLLIFLGILGVGGYILYNAWSQINDLRNQLRIIVEDSEQTHRRQEHLEGQLDLAHKTIALYRDEGDLKSDKIAELEQHLEDQQYQF